MSKPVRNLLVGCVAMAWGGFILYRSLNDASKQIEQLPDFVAHFDEAQRLCYERVRAAKDTARRRNLPIVEVNCGRDLYMETKAKFNGSISLLVAALARKPNKDDLASIQQQLALADDKMNAFFKWTESIELPVIGGNPIESAIDGLPQFLQYASQAHERMIARLIGQLNRCQLGDWDYN